MTEAIFPDGVRTTYCFVTSPRQYVKRETASNTREAVSFYLSISLFL